MQVDDRAQLAAVWLVDGPGPEAVWPLGLGGRYAEDRGEWYFPKGTNPGAILTAAGVTGQSGNGHSTSGLFDPLIEEIDERGVEVHEADSPRLQAVTRAVKAWTDQLIDRSARNNLLFFRDQRAGTLDLTRAPPRPVFDVLAGRSRTLAQLVAADEDALDDSVRRARTIHNKAQAIYEERGIHTLYLACGLATWENQHGTAVPAAPVLLAPATLTARGAAQQDYDLQVTGELEVNPTLLNALSAEFDVDCDPDALLASAGMEGAIDTQEELDIAYAWLSEQASEVPGFSVRPKTVLGNFSYAKLPMVRDLQGSVEALAAHELIAALAGDPDAQQAIRDRRADVDPSLPDQTPPGDEFLVLDADSSQNFAINKILAGQDLVIKGPPGTGKSQTISNLIAALVARGQSVLFVAEKRAAIDAVLKRLAATTPRAPPATATGSARSSSSGSAGASAASGHRTGSPPAGARSTRRLRPSTPRSPPTATQGRRTRHRSRQRRLLQSPAQGADRDRTSTRRARSTSSPTATSRRSCAGSNPTRCSAAEKT